MTGLRAMVFLALLTLAASQRGAQSQPLLYCPIDGGSIVTQLRIGGDLALLASYRVRRSDAAGREALWTGDLQAVFVDAQGWLREDGDRDARLGDYAQDPAIALDYDSAGVATRLRRYQSDPQLGLYSTLPFESLRPLWSASSQLAAGGARQLFTALDLNLDGRLDRSEQLPFLYSSFAEGRYGLLDADPGAAAALLDYVRGAAVAGLRARELAGSNGVQTQRLGMIVHSMPLLVGAPAEAYDLLYADAAYARFAKRYRQRRRVAYVGAHDGLLHAFNAGFRDGGENTDGKPPGAELWAYAPYNLLPHLRELSGDTLPRNAVVDASPFAFDARIFGDDADHPGGWGTVLCVGLRLGGAPKALSRGAAPAAYSGFAAGADTLYTRPALVLMDISNPEQPPQLLAELSDATLGFTVSQPAAFRVAGRWFLLFGSGPDDAATATAGRNARLYVYDLAAGRYVAGYAPRDLGSSAARSFVGSAVSVDWNLDFDADSVYFGTVGGDPAAPGGKLYRLDLHDSSDPARWTLHTALDAGRPLPGRPAPRLDAQQRRWIYTASGRLLVDADAASHAPQSAMAVLDRGEPGGRNAAQLFDASAARLDRSGRLAGIAGIANLQQLRAAVEASGGWRVDWPVETASAERAIGNLLLAAGTLLTGTAVPQAGSCLAAQRRLYALDADTGARRVEGGEDEASVRDAAPPSLGSGPPAAMVLHQPGGASGSNGLAVLAANAGAPLAVPLPFGAPPPRSGEIDGWELHP